MLTPAEALLMQAAKDEEQRLQAMNAAGLLGTVGGGLIGTAGGQGPHMLGKAIGALKGSNHRLKPGARMAGGLTGAILGGALGAGTAALMKRESPAANLLGKIQAQGGRLTPQDEYALASALGEAYTNPSELGMR